MGEYGVLRLVAHPWAEPPEPTLAGKMGGYGFLRLVQHPWVEPPLAGQEAAAGGCRAPDAVRPLFFAAVRAGLRPRKRGRRCPSSS